MRRIIRRWRVSDVTWKADINTATITTAIESGSVKGMRDVVEFLLTEANKHVPHDEGTLERSGQTGVAEQGSKVVGSVSYDTPYAVRQHEDMSLHHYGKGQSKWLENTFAAETSTVRDMLANRLRGELS